MKLGFIGLGRMGFHMVERLLKHKIEVVAYNRSLEKVKEIARKGAIAASSVEELVDKLDGRRIIWIMLPAGNVTDAMIKKFSNRPMISYRTDPYKNCNHIKTILSYKNYNGEKSL